MAALAPFGRRCSDDSHHGEEGWSCARVGHGRDRQSWCCTATAAAGSGRTWRRLSGGDAGGVQAEGSRTEQRRCGRRAGRGQQETACLLGLQTGADHGHHECCRGSRARTGPINRRSLLRPAQARLPARRARRHRRGRRRHEGHDHATAATSQAYQAQAESARCRRAVLCCTWAARLGLLCAALRCSAQTPHACTRRRGRCITLVKGGRARASTVREQRARLVDVLPQTNFAARVHAWPPLPGNAPSA